MTRMKPLILAAACLLMVATTTAQDRKDVAAQAAAAAVSTDGAGARTEADVIPNSWNWYLPNYVYNSNLGTGTRYTVMIPRNSGDYYYIPAVDERGSVLVEAAASNHWHAIYWTSSSTWSDILLYYY